MTPFRTILIFVVFAILGLGTLPIISVNLKPDHNIHRITVTYSHPEAPPEIIEQQATSPLENVLSQIQDIKAISSQSSYNRGSVTLTFNKHTDMDFKRFEIASMIRRTYPRLGKGLSYPVISDNDNTGGDELKRPILIYDINAPYTPLEIKYQLEAIIKSSLAQLPGVSDVLITGTDDMQIIIKTDYRLLKFYGLKKKDIIKVLRQKSFQQNLGMVRTEASQKLFIKVPKAIQDLSEIENTIIKQVRDPGSSVTKLLLIRDIADVYTEVQTPTKHFRINGQNAIRLSIMAEYGENVLTVARQVKRLIDKNKQKLPAGFNLAINYDETEFILEELDKIYYRSWLSALILISFILALYRSLKYLLILFSGIAVNLCITALFIYTLDVQVHLYTLMGITISLGLIMDNAIVMLDHLHRKKNQRIFIPLLAASLTTIAALLVIFLLPEEGKQNLIEFSAVISINLMVSLLVAIGYTPAMYHMIYGSKAYKPLEAGEKTKSEINVPQNI